MRVARLREQRKKKAVATSARPPESTKAHQTSPSVEYPSAQDGAVSKAQPSAVVPSDTQASKGARFVKNVEHPDDVESTTSPLDGANVDELSASNDTFVYAPPPLCGAPEGGSGSGNPSSILEGAPVLLYWLCYVLVDRCVSVLKVYMIVEDTTAGSS